MLFIELFFFRLRSSIILLIFVKTATKEKIPSAKIAIPKTINKALELLTPLKAIAKPEIKAAMPTITNKIFIPLTLPSFFS